MPIKPNRLRLGDTIGVIAPASPPPDPRTIDRCVNALARLGFKAKLGSKVRKRRGFLAGSDRERASDLMSMVADPTVSAIICLRGGYGTSRLLPLLNYSVIRANPKICVGYSDITSLHCAFLSQARIVSFHGPMMNSDFVRPELNDFTLSSFLRTSMNPAPPGSICEGYREKTIRVLRRGFAEGRLMGGNLSMLCATIGTKYCPSFRGRILFLEDLNEEPYRFDRMLTQLLNAGLLQQVAGLAIGLNRGCEDPKASKTSGFRQTVEDVLRERLRPLRVPIVCGLPFGHTRLNATLPVGVRAQLDAHSGDLIVTESAVT